MAEASLAGVPQRLRPLDDAVAASRTADERLYLRFPALYRLLARGFAALGPRSRLRQAMVARLILRAYAAGNRRDFDVILLGHDAAHEYRPAAGLTPPDLDSVYRGHEGYLRLWRYWQEAFEDIRWDPEELVDFGDRILVTTKQRGSGSGSGLAVSAPVYQLFELRRGLVLRQSDFLDRSEAFAAAGVGG